jgi:DNA invertase Pin-like site-specific DNA recombinase
MSANEFDDNSGLVTENTDGQAQIRAAQYVRMSTEHQQYSAENQCDAIREYANSRGIIIVRTYADEGKSGLRLDGREALKELIHDVENGKADFDLVLVYDVSRWGRFQDADESAYYEYICRSAGVDVEYCAEQFKNDGSPISTIVKGVKRAMAGEYSRELSAKVFKGQCRLIELGYRQGGTAGYGLRRMLVDQHGNSKGILALGEYKSIQTDRVILVPGPPEEVATVGWIYKMFVDEGKSEMEIAEALNSRGLRTDLERPWNRVVVQEILRNEKYIGNNVYNKTSFRLKKAFVQNPPEMWIRADGAFEAIVDPQLFYKAQGIIMERNRRFSNEEMLDRLKLLYERKGQLSGLLIDETDTMPSSCAYRHRFGSLIRAYRLIGYNPERDYQYLQVNRFLRDMYPQVLADVFSKIENLGGVIERDKTNDLLTD